MVSSSLFGQGLQVIDTLVDYGSTNELNRINKLIRVYNPNSYGVEISSVESFGLFDTSAFIVSDTSLYLVAGDTAQLQVGFLPAHNVAHSLPLIIKSSTGFGHTYVTLTGQGTYSKTYYQGSQNKSGSQLKTALKNKISTGYNSLGYTSARDNMYASIDNKNGDVECVYTGRTATFNTRAGANANSFNCEHTFPQGMFSQNEPMRSDIHHLFPTDVSANSQRGNDAFGVVSNPSWNQGGSKSGGGKFEPRDIQKGGTARAMMYFVLRYQDYSNFFQGQENILYNWHRKYSPGPIEIQRNSDIASLQNNRNPFVDYPQLMDRMRSLVGSADLVPEYDLYYSDDTIDLANGNLQNPSYSFIVYNRGGLPLKLYDWQLSNSSLSFDSSFPDTLLLQAGAVRSVAINYDASLSYHADMLSFSTSDPGMPGVVVPINSDASFQIAEASSSELNFYPNPTMDRIQFETEFSNGFLVEIIDLRGEKRSYRVEDKSLYLADLPKGIYFIKASNQQRYQKLIVR